jgi:hypothetical protein
MRADVVAVTRTVVSSTLAEVKPAGTRTLAGTETMVGLALASNTNTPPAGATLLRTTLAVEGLPPTTTDGRSPTQETIGGLIAAGETPSRRAAGLPENPLPELPTCALSPHPGSEHKVAANNQSDHGVRF